MVLQHRTPARNPGRAILPAGTRYQDPAPPIARAGTGFQNSARPIPPAGTASRKSDDHDGARRHARRNPATVSGASGPPRELSDHRAGSGDPWFRKFDTPSDRPDHGAHASTRRHPGSVMFAPAIRLVATLLCFASSRPVHAVADAEIAIARVRHRMTARVNPLRNKELLTACRAVGEAGVQARETFCREVVPRPLKKPCWGAVNWSIQAWANLCYEWFGDW